MNSIRRLSLLAAATISLAAPAFGARLVVLNKSDGDVSILNAETGREVARLPVGTGPHEAATSPDGKTVVVCNYGHQGPGNSLTVLDMEKMKVVQTISLGIHQRPHGIAYLKDGERVVVTTEGSKSLLIVDVKRGRIDAAIGTDQDISHMVAVTPDERLAFVANIRSGSVSVIDLVKRELMKVIPTGAGAEGVFAHPTRPEVWVTNRDADTVTIIDTNTVDVVRTLESGRFPIRVAITPDGAHALVSCARGGDVWVYDVEKREKITTIAMDARALSEEERQKRLFGDQFDESPVPVGILIEPSGERAYVANTNADVVTVLDLKTWRVAGRLIAGKEPDGMTWVK